MSKLSFLFAALVIAVGVAGLVGCGDGSSGDTLANIKKAGVLKWGADAEGGGPFVFRDEKDTNKIIGFEMDMMEKIAGHMGVKAERQQAEWEKLIPALLSKRSDLVMNGFEINEERKKVAAFSQPYYSYEQQLTVRVDDKDKIKSLADLAGKKVGTLANAEANNVLKEKGFKDDQILTSPDSTLPYKNLSDKRVDAVLQESIIASFYAGDASKYHNIPETFGAGLYGIVVRPDDKALLAEADRILALMKENGELAAIYKKWSIWNDKQAALGIKVK